MKPDVLLVPVLALRARAALYFGNYAEAEASAGKIISEGHHSLFRVSSLTTAQQKEADEMDAYIDYAAKGIDKDKFVKVCSVMNHCGTKVMHLPLIRSIL